MEAEFEKEFSKIEHIDKIGLIGPDRSNELGKSMPMDEVFCSHFSLVGVHYCNQGTNPMRDLKFIHIGEEKFLGQYVVLIFMDNKLTQKEIDEWIALSDKRHIFR